MSNASNLNHSTAVAQLSKRLPWYRKLGMQVNGPGN